MPIPFCQISRRIAFHTKISPTKTGLPGPILAAKSGPF